MEFPSRFRGVRRPPVACLLVLLIASLMLAACGSSGGVKSVLPTLNQLSNSRGLAVDSSRNIYIADTDHNDIVKVTQSTDLLTVFAGTGAPGYSGDGGPASSARLNFPQGVAVDSAGNIFIADTGNNRIRKVSAGNINTIAGTGAAGFLGDNGPAVSAELNGPQAVALDSSGNLYIADTNNSRIRKIVLATGTISTVAVLNTPVDLKVDSSGNLYIADAGDNLVRQVSPSGTITTVAGGGTNTTGAACLNSTCPGDGGPATSAPLNNPQAVAVDSSGNLYIADTGNNVIRKVSGGTITTAVGNGTQGYGGDGGSPAGAELTSPNGLTFDAGGTLYIDDAGNHVVRTVSF